MSPTSKDISGEVGAIRDALTQEKVRREALQKRISALRAEIKGGGATTGDRITDYLLATHGVIDDTEVSQPLRRLEARLKGKVGQLVLVVTPCKREPLVISPHRSSFDITGLNEQYVIGVLSSEFVVFASPNTLLSRADYGVPTDAYVEITSRQSSAQAGPLLFERVRLPPDGMELLGGCQSASKSRVYVGDDEVLGHVPSSYWSGRWVLDRNRAIRLLGKEVAEAPEEVADRARRKGEFETSLRNFFNEKSALRQRDALIAEVTSKAREFEMSEDPLVLAVLRDLKDMR